MKSPEEIKEELQELQGKVLDYFQTIKKELGEESFCTKYYKKHFNITEDTNSEISKETYTPGPWFAYNTQGNSGLIFKNWKAGTKERAVCRMYDNQNEIANAKLIACAPELLEALQDTLATKSLIMKRNPSQLEVDEILNTFNRINTIIKKATE